MNGLLQTAPIHTLEDAPDGLSQSAASEVPAPGHISEIQVGTLGSALKRTGSGQARLNNSKRKLSLVVPVPGDLESVI